MVVNVDRADDEAVKAFKKWMVASAKLSSPVVAFLASDDSAWVTGERICAAGGWR
jgi:NAD(P)-dependent dehydrogenase (short-subunit alcohol dehydrogenase family)